MSDRPCNKCELDMIKRQHRGTDNYVTVKRAPRVHFPNGVKVYVYPKTTKDHERFVEEHFVAWFAKVPKQCEC